MTALRALTPILLPLSTRPPPLLPRVQARYDQSPTPRYGGAASSKNSPSARRLSRGASGRRTKHRPTGEQRESLSMSLPYAVDRYVCHPFVPPFSLFAIYTPLEGLKARRAHTVNAVAVVSQEYCSRTMPASQKRALDARVVPMSARHVAGERGQVAKTRASGWQGVYITAWMQRRCSPPVDLCLRLALNPLACNMGCGHGTKTDIESALVRASLKEEHRTLLFSSD